MLAVLVAAFMILATSLGKDKTEVAPLPESSSGQMENLAEPKTCTVGEKVELKSVDITCEGVTEYPGTKFNQPDEGKVFLILGFTIKNKTSEEMIVSSKMWFETTVDGKEVTVVTLRTKETGGKAYLDGIIAPKKSMSGVVVYQVPIEYKEVVVKIKPIASDGEEVTFMYSK